MSTVPRPSGPPDPRTAQVRMFYETLTPETLVRLDAIYAKDAGFIDPFNDVVGCAAIQRVFAHMFETLDAPRFEVLQSVTEGDECFLLWNFRFRHKRSSRAEVIHGATHLRFSADGRVQWHRDYWDPARELYEGLPILGRVLRWLRRRLSAAA